MDVFSYVNFHHLRHMRRYREIANVLARHGFGFLSDQLGLKRKKRKGKAYVRPNTAPERARMVLEELGPTYVKLGQLLSTRPDLVPPPFIKELEKLQDNVPPFPFSQVVEVLREEGIEIDQTFSEFEEQPIASASIAQVHRAVLHSGELVAVKVQRPGVKDTITTDLEILFELARMAEKRTSWGRLYQVVAIVREFANAILAELDFVHEGRNADTFRTNFAKDKNVLIPKVYWSLTTSRVLVMEYLGGIKVSDLEELRKAGIDLEKVATRIVESFFSQVYEHGFFHADPHPGNIAVTRDCRIIYYDFGQVGTVDEILKERGMDLVLAMIRYDVGGVTRALLQLGIGTGHVDKQALRRDVAKLQKKYYGVPLASINLGEAMAELVQLSFKYRVRVPPELSLMVKMLMTCESLVSQLDPSLSIVEIAEPLGNKILRKRYTPERIRHKMRDLALEYALIVQELPREIHDVVEQLAEGDLKIRLEHTNLRDLASKADVASNRLSLAIVIGSLIIGTSLVIKGHPESFLAHIPLAEVGFVLAAVLGLFLVYSIMQRGRY